MKKCKQITELISLQHEQKLSLKQQSAVHFHLIFCPYCRAFKQNSKKISLLMKEFKTRQEEE